MNEQHASGTNLRQQWKEQAMTTATMTLEDIRTRDLQLTSTTARRNTLEYLAGGTAAMFLLVMAVLTFLNGNSAIDMLMASGFAALVLGIAVAGIHLFRNSGQAHNDLTASGVDHLRRRLKHERDLLRSVWLWYIGPMLPGFALIYGGLFFAGNVSFAIIAGGLTLAFLLCVAIINRRAASQIEQEIRDLSPNAE
jgi:hypothetical protein